MNEWNGAMGAVIHRHFPICIMHEAVGATLGVSRFLVLVIVVQRLLSVEEQYHQGLSHCFVCYKLFKFIDSTVNAVHQ